MIKRTSFIGVVCSRPYLRDRGILQILFLYWQPIPQLLVVVKDVIMRLKNFSQSWMNPFMFLFECPRVAKRPMMLGRSCSLLLEPRMSLLDHTWFFWTWWDNIEWWCHGLLLCELIKKIVWDDFYNKTIYIYIYDIFIMDVDSNYYEF